MSSAHHPASLSLTVSLEQSGKELWRTSIHLPTSPSSSSSSQDSSLPSTLTSDTGSQRLMTESLSKQISDLANACDANFMLELADHAFGSLGMGDGSKNPVLLAMESLRDTLIAEMRELVDGA